MNREITCPTYFSGAQIEVETMATPFDFSSNRHLPVATQLLASAVEQLDQAFYFHQDTLAAAEAVVVSQKLTQSGYPNILWSYNLVVHVEDSGPSCCIIPFVSQNEDSDANTYIWAPLPLKDSSFTSVAGGISTVTACGQVGWRDTGVGAFKKENPIIFGFLFWNPSASSTNIQGCGSLHVHPSNKSLVVNLDNQ